MNCTSKVLFSILCSTFMLSAPSGARFSFEIPPVTVIPIPQYVENYKRTNPKSPFPLPHTAGFDDFCLPTALGKQPTKRQSPPLIFLEQIGQMAMDYIDLLTTQVSAEPSIDIYAIGSSYFSCIEKAADLIIETVVNQKLEKNYIENFDNNNIKKWDQVMKRLPLAKAVKLISIWQEIQNH